MTDDARCYNSIGREFAGHHTTLHSNREFARPGGIQSNTAENFFNLFKRGLLAPISSHERQPRLPVFGPVRFPL